MKRQKQITAVISFLSLLVLILDAETAVQGASRGIELCMKTVIPSLYPFLFLCSIITSSLWGEKILPLEKLSRWTGIPENAQSVLIAALLGGYPAGAQTIGDAYRDNKISTDTAKRLLCFCSNAGPAFLFGLVSTQFPRKDTVLAVCLILILSSLFTGRLTSEFEEQGSSLAPKNCSIAKIIENSAKTMGIICSWIILFQIITNFFSEWFLNRFPLPLQIFVTGLLELSSGCCMLTGIENLSLRFVICTCMVSFGGLCVIMQTSSVIGQIPLRPYILGKLFQTVLCLIISFLFTVFGWIIIILYATIFFSFPDIKKINMDFRKESMYNADIKDRRTHIHAVP